MNRTTKKWIRIGAILLVLAVSAGLLIKNMNIEPADYTSRVESEIAEAEKLVNGVDITKGEYTTKSIENLRAAIEEAQAVLDDPASAYSDKKEAAQNLKAGIDKFIESKGKPEETKKEYITSYITIECHNLVGKEISGDKKPYVPADGNILPRTAVKVEKGQSVFDVLNKICRDKNIHLASRYTPLYGSYYIEGINHLFEFDGGQNSGWMYKVNGWVPNYGCSEYALSGGEEIVWCYTCNLGKDVGDNSMW